jgi:CheY-like chemotaxis protein
MSALLYVDDDVSGAEPFLLYLRRAGYDVTHAASGADALAGLLDGSFDLILLDVRMPQMDGLEVLSVLRSYSRWQHLPVILLTAYADVPAVERTAARHGADLVNKAAIDFVDLEQLIAARLLPTVHNLPGAAANLLP